MNTKRTLVLAGLVAALAIVRPSELGEAPSGAAIGSGSSNPGLTVTEKRGTAFDRAAFDPVAFDVR
jgi:hypothetical protein